ncbi:hypothetical protein D7W79_26205 [Corallococcus exercitus]|uniref:hypothetical protein n=1 Tax=Corallococcus exercitus TaxID=2316736 RepID=UPI000EA16C5F|nr:hypothetical protein [Corallococcus exercitus]RKG73197.1 hypothetical protein D7W79_26205 [Corallococcus exercitus]
MPNLDTLLKSTMLLTAAPGAKFQSFGPGASRATGGSTSGTGQWMHLGRQMLDEWPMPAGKSWAMFYWVLRYCRSGDTVRERLLEEGAPVP